ncbi:MAG: hypothetical protein J5787_05825 [Alphaproteobacteria bacterium]|nr:hypothetical protein [Alphaproteobacteria bacterium]
MAKNKGWGINFEGFTNLSERYQKLGGDLKKIADECLEFIPAKVNPGLDKAISKHKRTGKTAKSLVKGQKPTWTGDTATIQVGFDISHGGLPSVFLMYGTAKHTPRNQYGTPKRAGAKDNPGIKADKNLYNAIYGAQFQKEISAEQEKIYTDAIQKRLND